MLRATYLSINIIYTPAAVYVSAETSLFASIVLHINGTANIIIDQMSK